MALTTGSGASRFTGIPAASAVPLIRHLTVILRTVLDRRSPFLDSQPTTA
jgi:hypothetical protein